MTAKTPISKHKKRRVAGSLTFLFLKENICCGHSLEASQRDHSNEHKNKSFNVEIREILTLLLQRVSSCKTMHIYFSPVTKLNLAYHKKQSRPYILITTGLIMGKGVKHGSGNHQE